MKKHLVIVLLMLAVIGSGCFQARTEPTSSVIEPSAKPVEVLGVVTSVDEATRRILLVGVSGIEEEIEAADEVSMDGVSPGSLVEAFGTRESSTQRILARTIRVKNETAIVLAAPESDATVTSPLMVSGFANDADRLIFWRVGEETGVADVQTTQAGYGVFEASIFLPAMSEKNFTLELFTGTGSDGTIMDLQTISLKLLTTETSTFDVYLTNDRQNSARLCETVFGVARTVAQTSAVARASFIELLKGPTEEEKNEGFTSALSSDFRVSSLVISSGTAKVDIPSASVLGLRSCRQKAIAAQIRETLSHLPGVAAVELMLDGNPEKLFAP